MTDPAALSCKHCGKPIGQGLRPDEWWHVRRYKNGKTVFKRPCTSRRNSTIATPEETSNDE